MILSENASSVCRCEWPTSSDIMITYHDQEWGKPVHDDALHFEFLTLDAFQAGLSWLTILKKRDAFRLAFEQFDVNKIALFTNDDVERLMMNAGIVRNRLKITATIGNARAFIRVQEEYGTFDSFIWQFTNFKTIHNNWATLKEIPAVSNEATIMSKALKKRGFSFVGPTICYAYMQAAGMVNDHIVSCFRHQQIMATGF